MRAITSRTPDKELIRGVAAGREAAFDELYLRYLPTLTGYFRRRVADQELAFDLTAETFAAVIESSGRFDARKGSAPGWLFLIAHRKLVNSYRHGRVESAARQRLALEPVAVHDQDLERVDELTSEADEEALSRLLAALPADQRMAILSRVVDEQPYEAIARNLSCSEAVVRQRVSRGLRDLKLGLEEIS